MSIVEMRCPRCGSVCYVKDERIHEYRCEHCGATFRFIDTTKSEVMTDTRTHHCPICGRPVKAGEWYVCKECGKDFLCSSCAQELAGKFICKECVHSLRQKLIVFEPSEICPRCNTSLTYVAQYNRWYCQKCNAYAVHNCPKCGKLATYIPQYKRWYCYECRTYLEKVHEPYVTQTQGAIIGQEFICDACGKKKELRWLVGKCVRCGRLLCDTCAKSIDNVTYCAQHAAQK